LSARLDRRVFQHPAYLRLFVSLRVVGEAVTLVENVYRRLDGGATNPKRQGAGGVEPGLAGERDCLALDAVEIGRHGIGGALRPLRHLRPDEEAGTRAPADGRHYAVRFDPGDGRHAIEDGHLATQPFEGTKRIKVGGGG